MLINNIEKLLNSFEENNIYHFEVIFNHRRYNLEVTNEQLNLFYECFVDKEERIKNFKKKFGMIDLQSEENGLIIALLDNKYKLTTEK